MKGNTRPESDADARGEPTDDETLPSVEAVLAGTLALMTGVAEHPLKGMRPLETRRLMAAKVVDNLLELGAHPCLSDPMRRVMHKLCGHWQRIAAPSEAVAASEVPPCALWHRNPGSRH
jgi:hypothetical protein